MANKNFQKKKIQDTKDSGFGNYQEGVGGGGSPKAKDPSKRAPGVNSDYRQNNNNTMQARTDDGKFTYKSVNGQPIDPKYGPSRGKTVNPLLTGGQNGIKIEDVENQFIDQKGEYWDKYKGSWTPKGGEVVVGNVGKDWKVRVAKDSVWNVAKRKYDVEKGEFEGENENFSETKKGRPGKDEAAAKQKAQASGEEQAVIDQKTGGIKLKPGTVLVKPEPKKSEPKPAEKPAPTPVIPSQPKAEPEQPKADATQTVAGSAYTKEEIGAAREALISAMQEAGIGYNGEFDDDSVVIAYLDENGGKELFSYEEAQDEEEPKNEQESEAEKKIKAMGFSE